MRLLVAGGSSFVGRGIVHAAVAAGHNVTTLNRGVTPTDIPSSVTRLIGDRDGDLSALEGQHFDVTIDTIAYLPGQVAALAKALDGRGGHHVQISSVSAYEEPDGPGSTEATLRLYAPDHVDPAGPVTGATYGPLKAACEAAAATWYDEALSVVRPTYVIGAHDKTMRFPYWVQRLQRGGTVAAPGPLSSALQWIDARDLGAFVVRVAEASRPLAVHTASDPRSLGDVLRAVAAHFNVPTTLVEVPGDVVLERGLVAQFPLWAGPTGSPSLALDSTAAHAAGLQIRSLEDSVADTWSWVQTQAPSPQWLTAAIEAELVATFG
jgi:2'-hydroxyisoflavone reductase